MPRRASRWATSRSRSSTRRSAGSRRPAPPGRRRAATGASTSSSPPCALTAPAGELSTLKTPHTAAGPSLRELVLGSEGALGVITQVTARVRPVPERRRYEAWMAADFASGAEIVRALAQSRSLPDVVRVSDEAETRISLAMSGTGGGKRALLGGYLRLRRRDHGCDRDLRLGGRGRGRGAAPGDRDSDPALRRRGRTRQRTRQGLGARPLRRPLPARRAHGPRLPGGDTRERRTNGASCSTFTTRFGRRSDPRSRPRAPTGWSCATSRTRTRTGRRSTSPSSPPADRARSSSNGAPRRRPHREAIVEAGGTITHHHGVGRDHVPYMRAEIGELGIDALRAVKERLDPAGIMNPGKLLP